MSTQLQKDNIELTKMNASSQINIPKFFGLKQIAFDAAGVLDNPVYLSRDKNQMKAVNYGVMFNLMMIWL